MLLLELALQRLHSVAMGCNNSQHKGIGTAQNLQHAYALEWVISALAFCLERCCLLCTCSQVLHMSMSSAWNTKITQGWLCWLRAKVCWTSCPASDGGQEQPGAYELSGLWELLIFCWPGASCFGARRIFHFWGDWVIPCIYLWL